MDLCCIHNRVMPEGAQWCNFLLHRTSLAEHPLLTATTSRVKARGAGLCSDAHGPPPVPSPLETFFVPICRVATTGGAVFSL